MDAQGPPAPTPIEINGTSYDRLADGEYDIVFVSTGLKECILAGLLAVRGWKVLQMDRNGFYGGACASMNLEELFKHHNKAYDKAAMEARLGPSRSFCVDLVPKFLMAYGNIVKMLVQTGVTNYIEFNGVAGSYVVAPSLFSGPSIYRVPVTPTEALKSSLVGPLQKPALVKFAQWLDKVVPRDKTRDEAVEACTLAEFAERVAAYYRLHNPEKVAEAAGLVEQYKTRRLALVAALEKKYGTPVVPVEATVEFEAGPYGMRIDPRKFENTGSASVKSAIRVVGFQANPDNTPGQAEKSGKIHVGDLLYSVNDVVLLGLSDQEATKLIVEATRPTRIVFHRRAEHEDALYASQPGSPAAPPQEDLRRIKMSELYDKYGLDENSTTFIGHAMALETNDEYLSRRAEETVEKIQNYGRSVGRYGQNSPYLYPKYGLSSLPEGFSRLAAIYGGTVMLRNAPEEILKDAQGKVVGVRMGKEAAKCRFVVGDASYFDSAKSATVKKVVRSICLLKHPIANTSGGDSCQIILPAKTVKPKRAHDIYISCVSKSHEVSPQGVYVCICSTVAETADPVAELAPAFALLGEIAERFDSVAEVRGPVDAGEDGQIVVSGLDETSHFESAVGDILDVYRRVYGKALDLNEKLVKDQSGQQ